MSIIHDHRAVKAALDRLEGKGKPKSRGGDGCPTGCGGTLITVSVWPLHLVCIACGHRVT
jgi:hypothetical protein